MSEVGRPSEYKEEYCEKIIMLAKEGLFLEEIAEQFEVDYVTLWRWTKTSSIFCKAYSRAKSIIVSRLLRMLIDNASDRNFNVRAIEFVVTMITRQMQHTTVQVEGIDASQTKERLNAVLKALSDGKLRSDEFRNLIDGLKTVLEIEHGLEALEKLEKIEEKK